MATYSKVLLSGSTNGKAISVTGNPTTIHTAQAGTTGLDEVWIYAHNVHDTTLTLTINFGGNQGDDQIMLDIVPDSGLVVVIPGLPLNNAQVIEGSASNNSIAITGYVNRITA
jgi:hypothetical protein